MTQIRVDISCGSDRESCLQSPYPDISLIRIRNWTKGTCCGLNLSTNGKLFEKQLPVKHTSENCFFSRLNDASCVMILVKCLFEFCDDVLVSSKKPDL